MPIATPQAYRQMIDTAKSQSFAFPAVNCVGSEAVNAALKGFADAGSDGIIQFSTGGAEFASGLGVKDMVTGAVALAEFAHVVAQRYPSPWPCTRPLPQRQARHLRAATAGNLPAASRGRSGSAVQLPHVGRLSHPG
jgi:Fructose-bisphosphate aldolase class-II